MAGRQQVIVLSKYTFTIFISLTINYLYSQTIIIYILDQNIKRESGRKVQIGNANAAKVSSPVSRNYYPHVF